MQKKDRNVNQAMAQFGILNFGKGNNGEKGKSKRRGKIRTERKDLSPM